MTCRPVLLIVALFLACEEPPPRAPAASPALPTSAIVPGASAAEAPQVRSPAPASTSGPATPSVDTPSLPAAAATAAPAPGAPRPLDSALAPAAGPKGCFCRSTSSGFDLAIACGKQSCVDHTELTCTNEAKLVSGGRCGAATCACKVTDPEQGDVELACGLTVCLNGSTVTCDERGAVVRGAACSN